MKWGNHDINVVEWPNIPMFSKLDDTMTPFRLLELDFDDVLGLLSTPNCTEKADVSFEFTNEKTRSFVSMLLLRLISFQTIKCTGIQPQKQGLIQCLVKRSSIFVTTNNLISKINSLSLFT